MSIMIRVSRLNGGGDLESPCALNKYASLRKSNCLLQMKNSEKGTWNFRSQGKHWCASWWWRLMVVINKLGEEAQGSNLQISNVQGAVHRSDSRFRHQTSSCGICRTYPKYPTTSSNRVRTARFHNASRTWSAEQLH